MYNSLYGSFRQNSFSDWCESPEEFLTKYKESLLYETAPDIGLTDQNIKFIYTLLYSRYGNSIIASSDSRRFEERLFSLIWQYAPTWIKRVEIQKKLRNLSDEELVTGASAVFNTAVNPSTDPTESDGVLSYINQQNTNKYKKSKLEGYSLLLETLRLDVTDEFIRKFKDLFLTIVMPEKPLLYEEVGDE